ncbi:MAG: hypothetical protein KJP23_22560 [Deltaproteobacteria bacterium]|nr:hypothetical protein [Deltaproteobacteria bacterium]
MNKIKMENRWIKLGAIIGIIASALIISLGIYFTPDFVARNLSPDGIVKPSTVSEINIYRMGAVITGLLILIFSIAFIVPPHLSYSIVNMKFDNKYSRILIGLIAFVCLGIAALHIYQIVSIGIVNKDGGWYIIGSKMVLNGMHVINDLRALYTPLIFYSFAFWMKLFGTSYTGILLLLQFVNLANAILLFLLLMRHNVQRVLGLFISLSYFSYVLTIGGRVIFIEPFQIFFVLLAYYIFVKKPDSIIRSGVMGFLIGISIMYKQYSLVFLISALVMIFIANRKNVLHAIKGCVVLLMISILPLLIFCLIFNLSISESISTWFGPKAGNFATSGGSKMFVYDALINKYRIISYLSILVIFGYLSYKIRSEIGIYVFPFYLFSAVFFILRTYEHYYQLAILWQFLVMGLMFNFLLFNKAESKIVDNQRSNSIIRTILLCYLLFLTIKPIIYYDNYGRYWGSVYRKLAIIKKYEIKNAKQINQIFPKGSRVLFFNGYQYYVYCDLLCPVNNICWPLSYKALDKRVVDNVVVTGKNLRYYVTGGHHVIYPEMICKRLIEDGYIEILRPYSNYARFFTKGNNLK